MILFWLKRIIEKNKSYQISSKCVRLRMIYRKIKETKIVPKNQLEETKIVPKNQLEETKIVPKKDHQTNQKNQRQVVNQIVDNLISKVIGKMFEEQQSLNQEDRILKMLEEIFL